jgi:tetratricopeptide (TPR) repeat protein
MVGESADLLQHPRRNLGNRYRTQAQKFARLASKDPDRFEDNMQWAEQNARQALLHDFTDERNWRCLADIKVVNQDGDGLSAVLEDVFIVLGRDPEQIDQLKEVDFLLVGLELLEAAFARDPLDPNAWWEMYSESESIEIELQDFAERCRRLDFSDQRANIVYARRLERIRSGGREGLFIELARHLLAHRPNNHELWMELGRLYERRSEMDEAWSCYDHVQQLQPHQTPRDSFLQRITGKMMGEEEKPWTAPSIEKRSQFLEQMMQLSKRISTLTEEPRMEQTVEVEAVKENQDMVRLQSLMDAGDASEAFFLARRLVSQGEEWAEEWVQKAKNAF